MQLRTFFSIAIICCISSCAKNLDQIPQSTATHEAVFSSEAGLQLYTYSFYNMLPAIGDVFKTDCKISDYGAINSIPSYIVPNGYNSQIVPTGDWDFTNLRNINYFIANCTNSSVAQSVRENYIAIAKFFRAYFYYGMVQLFGNVPWYSAPINPNDTILLYKPRDPRTLVMDSIVADLDYAASHITSSNDPTRSLITKPVIFGFKSRVCLFEGTFRKYQISYNLTSTASHFLQMAADAADSVMAMKIYSLNTTGGDLAYRNVFISPLPVTSEVMLADIASSTVPVYNDANWYFTSPTYGLCFSFTRKFINTYLNIDGTPFTDNPGYKTKVFADETQNRDWRLQQTIRTPGYIRTTNGIQTSTPSVFTYTHTGYQPIKWCLDDTYSDNGTLNNNSVPLMRYAEILLNYAEAKAELGTITNDDWAKTVGALRARAGITSGLASLPTKVDTYLQKNYFPDISDPAILEIRRERGIELALEGFRFNDLMRWNHGNLLTDTLNGMYVPALYSPMDLNNDGKLDVAFYTGQLDNSKVIKGVTYVNVSADPQKLTNGSSGEINWLDNMPRTWQNYMTLYPIPYSQIQLNPQLSQNPGWE